MLLCRPRHCTTLAMQRSSGKSPHRGPSILRGRALGFQFMLITWLSSSYLGQPRRSLLPAMDCIRNH
jgi:hypothetical protein